MAPVLKYIKEEEEEEEESFIFNKHFFQVVA
jgi:hypothetical protein